MSKLTQNQMWVASFVEYITSNILLVLIMSTFSLDLADLDNLHDQ